MLGLFSNNNFNTFAKNELKHILNERSRVLCFSASDLKWQYNNRIEFQPEGRYYGEQYAPFKDFGVKEDNFYIVHPTDDIEDVKNLFREADVIVLLGGFMEVLEQTLIYFDLWDVMKVTGKHVIGTSAGAFIMLDKYIVTPYVDMYYNDYYTAEGLGLLKDCRLLVHWNKDYDKHQDILQYVVDEAVNEMVDSQKDIIVITLSDEEGIIVKNNYITMVGK